MVHRAILLTSAIVWRQANGFTVASRPLTSKSKVDHISILLRSTADGNDDSQFYDDFQDSQSQFYDDFGDSYGINTSSEESDKLMESLQTRLKQTLEIETDNDAKLERNWRRGNWSVRGFSLDKNNPVSDGEQLPKVAHVSAVAAPISSSLKDISVPVDETMPEYRTVAVGRTDGSVFLVRIGEAYLTKFSASSQLVENSDGGDFFVRVENKWTEQDQIRPEEQEDLQPFEILLDFHSSESEEKCHSIVYHDIAEDNNEGYVCTAAGDSGEILLWTLPLTGQQLQSTTLSGGHQTRIVSLKTAVLYSDDEKELHVLMSLSSDGIISFWDLKRNGKLLLSCQCLSGRNSDALVTCADISNRSLESCYSFDEGKGQASNDMLFIGTSDGRVLGYAIKNILSNGKCSDPEICFRAHGPDSGKDQGVTAINCGGDGTISNAKGASNPKVSSTMLFTGGEDGSVKQWEILAQDSPNGIRMEHWPRLSTQRMKNRAHLFSPKHEGKVAAISQQSRYDSSTFLSCGQDGSVSIWDAESGKMLYSMDGFTSSISSLACLGRDLLVTDGMDELVCVHDFSVEEDAASNGYELDW